MTTAQPLLTICILARDEAAVIARAVESARSVAHQVLVGDTGSTDETRALALAAGAEVIDVPWTDDFAAARNELMDHATGDWLLWLDADETLTADGAAWLTAELPTLAPGYYATPVKLRSGDTIWPVRLFPAGTGIRFWGYVQEYPGLHRDHGYESTMVPGLRIANDDSHRAGVARAASYRQHLMLFERERQAQPHHLGLYAQAAQLHLLLGEAEPARALYHQGLALAPTEGRHIGRAILEYGLMDLALQAQDAPETELWAGRLLKTFPAYPDALQALGTSQLLQDRPEEALETYQRLVNLLKVGRADVGLPTRGPVITDEALSGLAAAADACDKWQLADRTLADLGVDQQNPTYLAMRLHLRLRRDLVDEALDLYCRTWPHISLPERNQLIDRDLTDPYWRELTRAELWTRLVTDRTYVREAVTLLQALTAGYPQRAEAPRLLGALQFRLGDLAAAVTGLSEARARGDGDAVLITNLAVCQAKLGDLDAAERLFQEALALEPGLGGARDGLKALQAHRRSLAAQP